MKKQYIKPQIEIEELEAETTLTTISANVPDFGWDDAKASNFVFEDDSESGSLDSPLQDNCCFTNGGPLDNFEYHTNF